MGYTLLVAGVIAVIGTGMFILGLKRLNEYNPDGRLFRGIYSECLLRSKGGKDRP